MLRAAQKGLLPLLIALSPEVQARGVPVEVVAALLAAYPLAEDEVMSADQRALLEQAKALTSAAHAHPAHPAYCRVPLRQSPEVYGIR